MLTEVISNYDSDRDLSERQILISGLRSGSGAEFTDTEHGVRVWLISQNGFQSAVLLRPVNAKRSLVLTVPEHEQLEVDNEDLEKANPVELDRVEELVDLRYLNECSITHSLVQRFSSGQIHTYAAGPSLLAINPMTMLNIFSEPVMNLFTECQHRRDMPPHVFSIAQLILARLNRLLRNRKTNSHGTLDTRLVEQAICISGRSGSGKTRAVHDLLSYFLHQSNRVLAARIASEDELFYARMNTNLTAERLRAMMFILDAFTCSRIVLNTNASRAGRIFSLEFIDISNPDADSQTSELIVAGLTTRLLMFDRSRVTDRPDGEPNFHVFYYFLAGLDSKTRKELYLTDLTAPNLFMTKLQRTEDKNTAVSCWAQLCADAKLLGIKLDEEWLSGGICRLLAIVYHLGCAGCVMTNEPIHAISKKESDQCLSFNHVESALRAASLLGCSVQELNDMIFGATQHERKSALDCLKGFVQGVYQTTVHIVVALLNRYLSTGSMVTHPESRRVCARLLLYDPVGYQTSPPISSTNFNPRPAGLYELLVNYANDRLGCLFHESITQLEQARFEAEGLQSTEDRFYIHLRKNIVQMMDTSLQPSNEPQSSLGLFDLIEVASKDADVIAVRKALDAVYQSERKTKQSRDWRTIRRVRQSGAFVINHSLSSLPIEYKGDVEHWFSMCNSQVTIRKAYHALRTSQVTTLRNLVGSLHGGRDFLGCSRPSWLDDRGYFSDMKHNLDMLMNKIHICAKTFSGPDPYSTLTGFNDGGSSSGLHWIHCLLPVANAGLCQLEPDYDKCTKGSLQLAPNPMRICPNLTRAQLRGMAMLDTLKKAREGFPDRLGYEVFRQRYSTLVPKKLLKKHGNSEEVEVADKQVVESILSTLQYSPRSYLLGKEQVFLRGYILPQLELRMKSPEAMQGRKLFHRRYKSIDNKGEGNSYAKRKHNIQSTASLELTTGEREMLSLGTVSMSEPLLAVYGSGANRSQYLLTPPESKSRNEYSPGGSFTQTGRGTLPSRGQNEYATEQEHFKTPGSSGAYVAPLPIPRTAVPLSSHHGSNKITLSGKRSQEPRSESPSHEHTGSNGTLTPVERTTPTPMDNFEKAETEKGNRILQHYKHLDQTHITNRPPHSPRTITMSPSHKDRRSPSATAIDDPKSGDAVLVLPTQYQATSTPPNEWSTTTVSPSERCTSVPPESFTDSGNDSKNTDHDSIQTKPGAGYLDKYPPIDRSRADSTEVTKFANRGMKSLRDLTHDTGDYDKVDDARINTTHQATDFADGPTKSDTLYSSKHAHRAQISAPQAGPAQSRTSNLEIHQMPSNLYKLGTKSEDLKASGRQRAEIEFLQSGTKGEYTQSLNGSDLSKYETGISHRGYQSSNDIGPQSRKLKMNASLREETKPIPRSRYDDVNINDDWRNANGQNGSIEETRNPPRHAGALLDPADWVTEEFSGSPRKWVHISQTNSIDSHPTQEGQYAVNRSRIEGDSVNEVDKQRRLTLDSPVRGETSGHTAPEELMGSSKQIAKDDGATRSSARRDHSGINSPIKSVSFEPLEDTQKPRQDYTNVRDNTIRNRGELRTDEPELSSKLQNLELAASTQRPERSYSIKHSPVRIDSPDSLRESNMSERNITIAPKPVELMNRLEVSDDAKFSFDREARLRPSSQSRTQSSEPDQPPSHVHHTGGDTEHDQMSSKELRKHRNFPGGIGGDPESKYSETSSAEQARLRPSIQFRTRDGEPHQQSLHRRDSWEDVEHGPLTNKELRNQRNFPGESVEYIEAKYEDTSSVKQARLQHSSQSRTQAREPDRPPSHVRDTGEDTEHDEMSSIELKAHRNFPGGIAGDPEAKYSETSFAEQALLRPPIQSRTRDGELHQPSLHRRDSWEDAEHGPLSNKELRNQRNFPGESVEYPEAKYEDTSSVKQTKHRPSSQSRPQDGHHDQPALNVRDSGEVAERRRVSGNELKIQRDFTDGILEDQEATYLNRSSVKQVAEKDKSQPSLKGLQSWDDHGSSDVHDKPRRLFRNFSYEVDEPVNGQTVLTDGRSVYRKEAMDHDAMQTKVHRRERDADMDSSVDSVGKPSSLQGEGAKRRESKSRIDDQYTPPAEPKSKHSAKRSPVLSGSFETVNKIQSPRRISPINQNLDREMGPTGIKDSAHYKSVEHNQPQFRSENGYFNRYPRATIDHDEPMDVDEYSQRDLEISRDRIRPRSDLLESVRRRSLFDPEEYEDTKPRRYSIIHSKLTDDEFELDEVPRSPGGNRRLYREIKARIKELTEAADLEESAYNQKPTDAEPQQDSSNKPTSNPANLAEQAALQAELAALRKRRQDLTLDMAALQAELVEYKHELDLAQQARQRAEQNVDRLQSDLGRLNDERDADLGTMRATNQARVRALEDKLGAAQDDAAQAGLRCLQLEQQLNAAAAELKAALEARDTELEEKLLEQLKKYQELLAEKEALLEEALERPLFDQQTIKKLRNRIEELEESNEKRGRQKRSLATELDDCHIQLAILNKIKADLEDQLTQAKHEVIDVTAQLEEQKEAVRETQRRFQALTTARSIDSQTIEAQTQEINELIRDKENLRLELDELRVRSSGVDEDQRGRENVEKLEAKVRELEQRLEIECRSRNRLQAALERARDTIEQVSHERDAIAASDTAEKQTNRRLSRQLRDAELEREEAKRRVQFVERRAEEAIAQANQAISRASLSRMDLNAALRKNQDIGAWINQKDSEGDRSSQYSDELYSYPVDATSGKYKNLNRRQTIDLASIGHLSPTAMSRSHASALNQPGSRRAVLDKANRPQSFAARPPSSHADEPNLNPAVADRARSLDGTTYTSEHSIGSQQSTSNIDDNRVQRVIDLPQDIDSTSPVVESDPAPTEHSNRNNPGSSTTTLVSDHGLELAHEKSADTMPPISSIKSTSSETIEGSMSKLSELPERPAELESAPKASRYSTEKTLYPTQSRVLVPHDRSFVVDHHMTLGAAANSSSVTVPVHTEDDLKDDQ